MKRPRVVKVDKRRRRTKIRLRVLRAGNDAGLREIQPERNETIYTTEEIVQALPDIDFFGVSLMTHPGINQLFERPAI
jgi:hypothetical protein